MAMEAWCAAVQGVAKSWIQLSNWTELIDSILYIRHVLYLYHVIWSLRSTCRDSNAMDWMFVIPKIHVLKLNPQTDGI